MYMTISKYFIAIASQFAQLIVHSALSMLHYLNLRYCLFVGEIGICVLYVHYNVQGVFCFVQ